MFPLEQNARFWCPFYHILKSKFWVHNTCLTRGQTALFASLSTKFAKTIECFHSRGQNLCKFIGTKESVCIRKECNSQRIGLGHQHGRCSIVLGHQYGLREVSLEWATAALPVLHYFPSHLAYICFLFSILPSCFFAFSWSVRFSLTTHAIGTDCTSFVIT